MRKLLFKCKRPVTIVTITTIVTIVPAESDNNCMKQGNINNKQVKINENIKQCYYYAKVHWLIGLFDKKKRINTILHPT